MPVRVPVAHHRSGSEKGVAWSGRSDVERRMAVANALGHGGSNCAAAAQLKSPMTAWGTCGRF